MRLQSFLQVISTREAAGMMSRRCISTCVTVPLDYTRHGDPTTDRSRLPLVVVHGLFGQRSNWNSVAKAMQRRLGNVIYCIDMRNHGTSPKADSMTYADMAADLAEFVSTVVRKDSGAPRAHLLGHSMGGKAAMRLAVDPHSHGLLDKLIIEDVSPKGYSTSHIKFREYIAAMNKADMRQSRKGVMQQLEYAVPDLAVRQFLATNLQQNPSDPALLEWKCNVAVIDAHVDDVLGFSIPTGSFRGPTLFLYGAVSGYVPESDRPMIRCLFPQVVFEAIPDAGHWVHAEKPAEFINAVCKFLDN